MNYQFAIVGGLTSLALLAHVFGGIRQSLSIEPSKLTSTTRTANLEALDRNWVQSVCAFQLITVDLFALSALLFLLAFTNVIQQKQAVGLALSAFYFLWGCLWLIQLIALRRKAKDYLVLGHWIFWFFCSALIYWGALST